MTPDNLRRHLAALQMTFGIEMPQAPVPLPDVALLTEATDRAALAGAFDLHRLTVFIHQDDRAPVREALAAASAPVPASRLRWLDADRRRAALAVLLGNPAGLPALLARLRLHRDDAPGHILRALLRGWRPALARLSEGRLAALVTALGWLDGLPQPPGPALPDPRSVRLELTRRERTRGRDALLSDGFVGRASALAAVVGHTRDPARAGQVLIFTGPGGIGKSALLARATRDLARRTPPVPVFTFDFDQPSLDPRGPGLTLDLTRQLALLQPQAAAELSAIRTLLRGTFREAGGESAQLQSLESTLRATSEAGERIASLVRAQDLDTRPVLLVFDTLEVIAAQGPAALAALGEWLAFARHGLGLHQMRAVMAGRAAETAAEYVQTSATWPVPPLDTPESRDLLHRMGLDATRADAAAAILGGNPLVLRLGGRYLLDHPDAPASDLAEGGGADAALTQGLLYRRILNHVGTAPDDPLRRIAYPGLALRLVTPAILRDVIAPALGITLADDGGALWQRLTTQTWLVEPETATRVRHRRDLRTEMLRLMRRDAAAAPLATRLHQLALAHHRRADDPDLPLDRARLEAVYHALMLLPEGQEPDPEDASLTAAALGGDADDLPPHAAALARALSDIPARPEDIALVPSAWRDTVQARLAWAALDAEDPARALALDTTDTPWRWRLTALQMAADWNSPAARRTLDRLSPLGSNGAASWWPDHRARTADTRFATLAPRETQAQTEAAAAWLRLMRGDTDWVPGWSTARADGTDTATRIARLREAAAQAFTLFLAHDATSWESAPSLIDPGRSFLPDRSPDPLLADEMARLDLLRWAAGHLRAQPRRPTDPGNALSRAMARHERDHPPGPPDPRVPLRPAMIAATPARLTRMRALIAAHPEALGRLDTLIATLGAATTTAQLTGSIAQSAAEILTAGNGDRIDRLAAAGIRPTELIHGLMHEFRAPARVQLRALVAGHTARTALADSLPTLLFLADGPFLPADLHPRDWAKAAGQGDGSRAVASLVDWSGRIGRLDTVLVAAADLTETPDLAARLRRLARAAGLANRALAGLPRD